MYTLQITAYAYRLFLKILVNTYADVNIMSFDSACAKSLTIIRGDFG